MGQLVVTESARRVIADAGLRLDELLDRHNHGDWGDVSPELVEFNNDGIDQQRNLVSNYPVSGGRTITIFTKADRSTTMVHLNIGRSSSPLNK